MDHCDNIYRRIYCCRADSDYDASAAAPAGSRPYDESASSNAADTAAADDRDASTIGEPEPKCWELEGCADSTASIGAAADRPKFSGACQAATFG
jgi:hypothetical protein